MRDLRRFAAVFAALWIVGSTGTASAAWRFEENGPHARPKKTRSTGDGASASGGVTYGPACVEWRRDTIKPFTRRCIRWAGTSQ